MPIFITYARKDREAVQALTGDLERARNAVWLDNELTGGQAWWDTILGQIRACDLYMFALTPESLKSRACNSELDYAIALGRPLLPVLIQDVHLSLAPPAIANTQMVDYRTRTIETSIALISAVANRQAAPPLPDPLPVPPPPPMSYMNEFRELVDGPFLTYQQQNHLLADLRGYLDNDDDDRVAALQLLHALRRRRDIAESIGRELDQLLQRQAQPQRADYGQAGSSTATQAPNFFTAPPQSQGTPSGYGPPAQQYQQPPGQQPGGYPQVPQPSYEQPGYQATGYDATGYGQGGYAQNGGYQPPGQPVHQASAPQVPQSSSGGPLPPHPQAVVILVLAILSFFSCGITGIVSLVMGSRVSKEIQARPGQYGTQNLKGARTVAIVGIIVVVAYLIFVIASGMLSSSS